MPMVIRSRAMLRNTVKTRNSAVCGQVRHRHSRPVQRLKRMPETNAQQAINKLGAGPPHPAVLYVEPGAAKKIVIVGAKQIAVLVQKRKSIHTFGGNRLVSSGGHGLANQRVSDTDEVSSCAGQADTELRVLPAAECRVE